MTTRIKSNLPDDHRLADIRGMAGTIMPNISENEECFATYTHEFVPAVRTDVFYFINVDEIVADHSTIISDLRSLAATEKNEHHKIDLEAAAALLEVHDTTEISLDDWKPVRKFVESVAGCRIAENYV